MTWLLAIPAALLLLLCLPVFVTVRGTQELRVRVWVLGIPLTVLDSSRPEKPSKQTKKPSVKPSKKKKEQKKPSFLQELRQKWKHEGASATIEYVGELLRLITGTVRRFLRIVSADKLCVNLFVAADDAAETALRVGKLCSVVYPAADLLNFLLCRVRRRKVTVTPDFLATKTRVDLQITLHVIPLRVIGVLFGTVWRFFRIQTTHSDERTVIKQ